MTVGVAAALFAVPATAAAPQSTADLQSQLDALVSTAASHQVSMGIAVQDLSGVYGGVRISAGEHSTPFKAASTIKLGLAAFLMHGVDQGRWTLGTLITVKPGDVVGGSGTIQNSSASLPRQYTLASLMQLMITVSDNTATNVLIGFAGGLSPIGEYTQSLGLADSGFHLGRLMILPHPASQENWITPDEDAQLLTSIYQASAPASSTAAKSILSAASASQIITWMCQQQVTTKFGAVIPRSVLADKTGEDATVSHDTGYFLVPNREVAISVMTSFGGSTSGGWGATMSTANQQVQQAARLVYAYQLSEHPASASPPSAGSTASATRSPTASASPHASISPSPASARTRPVATLRQMALGLGIGGALVLAAAAYVIRRNRRRHSG